MNPKKAKPTAQALWVLTSIFAEINMKMMNCKQLGGACDKEFRANSFDEIAEISRQHGMEMLQKKDAAHLEAMNEMQQLMQQPEAMTEWFESKRKEFEALPES